MEQAVHMVAELIVEINHNIAAKNNIEFIKGSVCRQIMLRKNNVFTQIWLQYY
ncbi:hypothetical protein D3C76_1854360 [compost metagenome]